jgi:Ser/Thr protein kinase RdoA (MazF antagonist)
LRLIHRMLLRCRESGFAGVPALAKTEGSDTIVELGGRLYDAQEWLAGEPLSGENPGGGPTPNVVVFLSPTRLANLANGLACFHRSTAHLSPERKDDVSPLPARLGELVEATGTRHRVLVSDVQRRADGGDIAMRWLELLPRALSAACEASENLSEEIANSRVLCHGDLWPAHTYFDGDAFVGFTDFESLCFASPALDVAQLVLHFGGWETRANVLRSYEAVTPLTERERSLLPVEAVADLVGEGYWSLEALYGHASPETSPAQRAAHMLNLRQLIGSLERTADETAKVGS